MKKGITDPSPSHPSALMAANFSPTPVLAAPRRMHDTSNRNSSKFAIFPSQYSYAPLLKFSQKYEVLRDRYSNTQRLNLYAFDGAPLNAMYLVYKPPQMLPTQTLNPTTAAKTEAAQATNTASKARRSLNNEHTEEIFLPLNKKPLLQRKQWTAADQFWWLGAGMTALGSVGYFCF